MSETKNRRKALDGILDSASRSNEGSGGVIRRLLGDLKKDAMAPDEMRRNQKQLSEMLGHMSLSRNPGIDANKYGDLQKLLVSEYPSLEELGAVLDPNDPDFDKKLAQLKGTLGKGEIGHSTAFRTGDSVIPRSVVVNPKMGLNELEKTGTMLHEGRHAVDYGLGYDSIPETDLDDNMLRKARSNEDLVRMGSKGHHLGSKNFEMDAIGKMLERKGLDATDKMSDVAKQVKKGQKMLGTKLRGVPIAGSILGAGMAAMTGDATAAIPGLDSSEDIGMSAADENLMLAEEGAKVDYAKSPAHQARLKALLEMKK